MKAAHGSCRIVLIDAMTYFPKVKLVSLIIAGNPRKFTMTTNAPSQPVTHEMQHR